MKGSHYTLIFACALFWVFGFAGSHANFAGTGLSFFLSNGSRTKLLETCFAKLGRFTVLWLSALASENIETLKLETGREHSRVLTAWPHIPKCRLPQSCC